VRDWLAGRSTLPWETLDYVEDWKGADTVLPKLLKDGQSLQERCRALPMHALPIQKRIYEPPQQTPEVGRKVVYACLWAASDITFLREHERI
jgi:hypothetical protein